MVALPTVMAFVIPHFVNIYTYWMLDDQSEKNGKDLATSR